MKRIFNENKTIELNISNCDLNKGRLEESSLMIHHDAVDSIPEVGHYETIVEYPNGGKDVKWIVDVEGTEGHDSYDESEEILIYIPFTTTELRNIELKSELIDHENWLSAHDYIGTKIATGRATIDEYADIIAEMNVRANRINELRLQIEELED